MAKEINPNTPVQREETAEVKSGEAIDFESIEAIHDQGEADKAARKEAAKAKLDDKPPEDKEPDTEVEDDKGAAEEKPEASEAAKPEAEKHKTEAKLVKIVDGETTSELSESATIQTKVDGELQEVSIADLKKDYAGRVAYDRKFNELAKEKQNFNNQVQFVNDKVNEIVAMADEDPMMAFFELCRMNNTTPEDQAKAWEKFAEEVGEWESLSPEEQKAKLAIKERDYYKKSIDSDKKRQDRARKKAELDTQAENARKQYGLSDADYEQAEKVAEKLYPDGTAIGPREVITTHRINVVEQVLTDKAPDQVFKGSKAFGEMLNIAMQNPDFGADDLGEIAEQVYGNKTGRNLARKVKDSDKPPAQPQKPQSNEIYSFDQL